jgi:hypothetical protein
MKTLLIDGMTVSVADNDQSASIIERHIASLNKRISDADSEMSNFKKKKDDDDKELADAKKTIEARDGEIVVLKKQVADAAVTPAKLDTLVKARLAVIDAAKTVLPKEYVFDGKSEADIRKATVQVSLGDETTKSMSDGAVEGAFLAITAKAASGAGTSEVRDALINHRPGGVVLSDAEKAYAESNKRLSDAWREPNKAA